MQRIAIIGNAGGGKSLLARHLGDALDLPVFVVDSVQWRPGWTRTESAELTRTLDEWADESRWVIDGWGPWDSIERRFAAADTIIFVDLPITRHYWWAFKRQIEAALGRRADWPPPGCRALPITFRLFGLMRQIHREIRPRLLETLTVSRVRPRVVHIRTVDDLREFRRIISLCAPWSRQAS